jgi:hypothetical protein
MYICSYTVISVNDPFSIKCIARVRPHKLFFKSGYSDLQDVEGVILNRQFRSFSAFIGLASFNYL